MTAEAITYGQLAAFGQGTNAVAIAVVPITASIISVIDQSRSLPPRSTAFQLACEDCSTRHAREDEGGHATCSKPLLPWCCILMTRTGVT